MVIYSIYGWLFFTIQALLVWIPYARQSSVYFEYVLYIDAVLV